jgi:hypothetical protein
MSTSPTFLVDLQAITPSPLNPMIILSTAESLLKKNVYVQLVRLLPSVSAVVVDEIHYAFETTSVFRSTYK